MIDTCISSVVGDANAINNLVLGIEQGTIDKQDVKAIKEDFKKVVVQYITEFAPNYTQLVVQKNKAKPKPINNIADYALMRWKTDDNDDGFDLNLDI